MSDWSSDVCSSDLEPALIGAEIVERLVDDRQPDGRVDDISIRADAGEHTEQHRRRMADREKRHIKADVLHPVEEEDHTEEEEQMVVAGDHMLGAEIDERPEEDAAAFLDIALVAFGDIERGRAMCRERVCQYV